VSTAIRSRVAEAPIGHWPQGMAFSADGKTILVGDMVEKDYWLFEWNGSRLRATGQRVKMNGGPVAIRTADTERPRVPPAALASPLVPPLPAAAEESPLRTSVGVPVVGDVPHVVVHVELAQLGGRDLPQALPHVRHVPVGRC
jgi:hypothetical protein